LSAREVAAGLGLVVEPAPIAHARVETAGPVTVATSLDAARRALRADWHRAQSAAPERNTVMVASRHSDRAVLSENMTVSPGAPVRILRSLPRHGVRANAVGTVARLEPRGRVAVELDNGRELVLASRHVALGQVRPPLARALNGVEEVFVLGGRIPLDRHDRRVVHTYEVAPAGVELRAAALARAAELARRRPPWLEALLGPPPPEPVARQAWRRGAGAALAYRERWAVALDAPGLGPPALRPEQRIDRRAAERALHAASRALGSSRSLGRGRDLGLAL